MTKPYVRLIDPFPYPSINGLKALPEKYYWVGYIKNRRHISEDIENEEEALGKFLTLKSKYKSAFMLLINAPTVGTLGGIDRSNTSDHRWFRNNKL